MKKRLLVLGLTLCLALCLLPMSARAEEVVDSGSCGENVNYTLTDDGTLTIYGSGPMTNYTLGSGPWAYRSINKVVIKGGVTTIGGSAFYKCTDLSSVTIPDSVVSIGDSAFYECGSLTSIYIPDSVTTIGDYAFVRCNSLKTVKIPDSVTQIGQNAFWDCASLTSVTIPNSVTEIKNNTFSSCPSLTSIVIPDSVTRIGCWAFSQCTGLTSISIGSGVTVIDEQAFSYCTSLTSITIGDNVKNISDWAFVGCAALNDIKISASVTSIGKYAFYDCFELSNISVSGGNANYSSRDGVLFNKSQTKLIECPRGKTGAYTIPNGVTEIGILAFDACTGLTSISIPSSVIKIDAAFEGCTGLEKINVADGNPNYASIDGVLFNKNRTELIDLPEGRFGSYTIPDGVTTIATGAFGKCFKLTSVTIPSSVNYIGEAFQECNLEKIVFQGSAPNFHVNAFLWTTAECFYPGYDPTWTQDKLQDYRGTLTWTPYEKTHEHTYSSRITAPTCTKQGYTTYICSCGSTYKDNYTAAKGHTEVVDKAVAATCEKTGKTEGKHCSVCGTVLVAQESIPAKGHTEVVDKAVAATCETTGLTEGKHCSVCKTIIVKQETVPAKGHSFGQWKQTKVPTCTEKGTDTRSCACGKTETRDVNAKGHTEVIDKAVSATCTSTGLTEGKHCSVCNAVTVKQDTIPAKAHSFGQWKQINAPTCTEKGTETRTCACGKAESRDVNPKGHAWDSGKVTKEATETAEGEKLYTCTACGASKMESIPKLNHVHKYTDKVTAPTCTEKGYTTHTCFCGYNYKDAETAAKGHSFGEWKQTKAPTCTKKGTDTRTCGCGKAETRDVNAKGHTEVVDKAVAATCTATGLTEGKHCSVCNAVIVKQETIPAKGHSFGEWKQTKAPTCTEKGTDTRTCGCGKAETRDVNAKGHTEVVDKAVAATCTATGLTEGKHCSVCNAITVKQETIPSKDHTWDGGKVTREPTEKSEGEKLLTCTSCKQTKTESIPKLGHVHKYTDKVTASTCTEKGYTTHTCSCGHSYKDAETAAKGHSFGEWQQTKAPTCTEKGTETRTCACGRTETLDVNVKGHTEVVDMAVAATCTATGLTEGRHCSVCNTVLVKQETIPAAVHTEVTDKAVAATCTATGLTEGKHCSVCNTVTVKQETIPALSHSFESGTCTVCGEADPDWVEPTQPTEPAPTEPEEETPRVAGDNRFETANLVADQMKKNLGIEKFDAVVVASGTEFADALAGSYLAAVKNAPVLLAYSTDKINDGVKDYIKANLNPGGTVYILGGTKAVPESFQNGLEGFTVKRLAGDNRFLTNLLVLEEAGVGDKPILVCTGLGFADGLSASASKLPILLVYGKKLMDDQTAFLEANKGRSLYIIGGDGAVSKEIASILTTYGTVERVAGGNRFETSVLIAEKFFGSPKSAVLAYAWDFPDGLCGGPLAATMNAPLILTMEKYEAQAASYIQSNAITNATILGGEKLIPESSVNKIFP